MEKSSLYSKNTKLYPVILSGGAGSRLWPISREYYPKQLLNLCDDDCSLIQMTALRLQNKDLYKDLTIICNEEHRFIIADQMQKIQARTTPLILEPVGRNTAPAILLACLAIQEQDPEAIIVVCPADHHIEANGEFEKSIKTAFEAAKMNKIVTIGIAPTQPHTGYGYIHMGESYAEIDENTHEIIEFKEKPDKKTAQDFLKSKSYLWNSGIVVAPVRLLMEEIEKYDLAIFKAVKESYKMKQADLDFVRIDKKSFESSPSDSIEYAVFEKTDSIVTVSSQMKWSDVGSWASLWDVKEKDKNGNAIDGKTYLKDVKNCYIRSRDKVFVGIGVEDLIIIDINDAFFVAHKDKVDDVKEIHTQLKSENKDLVEYHRRVHRPWGYYDQINMGERFQVKRIQVKPGGVLSLQKHMHRAEHWIVVNGTARVTRDDEVFILSENESTFIPLGAMHRLENPGKLPLNMIEVQSGSYLGEDDIIRTEDIYGRSKPALK